MKISHNVVSGGSYDFVGADADPTEIDSDGGHGTSIAGIIAAKGWNDIGVRGVARCIAEGFNFHNLLTPILQIRLVEQVTHQTSIYLT